MAAFPPEKRLRATPSPPFEEEEETTDLKLALLSSLHPTVDASTLLELLLTSNGSVAATSSLLATPRTTPTQQSSLSTFLTTTSIPKPPRKGHTLHLYTPLHFAALTPTTLHPSFFSPNLATSLLTELLAECESFPPPPEFTLFDRAVVSPHTMCFYMRTPTTQGYSYQGGIFPETRVFTPSMNEATALVETKVNEEMRKWGRGYGQIRDGEWKVNAAFVNCYRGGEQSVGWHTDQLTYLGPKAVIASVSLGCVREFRVRRVIRDEGEKGERDGEGEGAYGLWLPHNSLLIMHAGMQEEWKHSIQPAKAVDVHPIAGNIRINITYRCYRESLKPEFTPRCGCKEPTVLRPVFGSGRDDSGEENGKGKGKEKEEGNGNGNGKAKYFWTCNQDYKVGAKGCGFFQWAEFDEFGEPPWSAEFKGDKGKYERVKVELKTRNNEKDGDEEWEKWPEEGGEEGYMGGRDEQDEWSDETVEGSERSVKMEDWEEIEADGMEAQEQLKDEDTEEQAGGVGTRSNL